MAFETVTSREGGGRAGRLPRLGGEVGAPRRGMLGVMVERRRGRLIGAILAVGGCLWGLRGGAVVRCLFVAIFRGGMMQVQGRWCGKMIWVGYGARSLNSTGAGMWSVCLTRLSSRYIRR